MRSQIQTRLRDWTFSLSAPLTLCCSHGCAKSLQSCPAVLTYRRCFLRIIQKSLLGPDPWPLLKSRLAQPPGASPADFCCTPPSSFSSTFACSLLSSVVTCLLALVYTISGTNLSNIPSSWFQSYFSVSIWPLLLTNDLTCLQFWMLECAGWISPTCCLTCFLSCSEF